MSVYIPEPVAYLTEDELNEFRDKQARIAALHVNPAQFDQYESVRTHFEMFVFMGGVYHTHGLPPTVDLNVNPATGAVTYEEVHIDMGSD